MAFKMKRTGVNLRSTTRVAPQLTKYQSSSPLHQEEDIEEAKVLSVGGEGNEQVSVLGEGSRGGDPSENTNKNDASKRWAKCCKGVSSGTSPTCPDVNCDRASDEDYDPCAGKKPCPDGSPGVAENGKCMCPGDKETFSGEVTGNYTSPGEMQPLTHILNPREMRRNNRMLRIGSDGDERSIKKANKNIRQAIRRGQEPSENDLAIISGQALGNYDGLNMKQDSSGYRDWFTGQQYKSVQTNPGGEMGKDKNYNDLVRSAAEDLYAADPSKYPDEASLLAAAEKATIQARTDGDGSDSRVAGGKYLSRRTRKLMEDRNVDTSRFGNFGKKGKSKRKRDYDKRKVTKYNNELKSVQSAFDADGNFDKEKAGMSKRKYDKLKRKSESRGGDVSAFKKKGSPIHMTVNVTKPSYKMGGFGSK